MASLRAAAIDRSGDWAFRQEDRFLEQFFQASPDLREGDRVSVLIFGDYQCETRLTVAKIGDEVRAEARIVRGGTVRHQLTLLRAKAPSASAEEIFQSVKIADVRLTSPQGPTLEKLWSELLAIRLPIIPDGGLMSPAVWFKVTAIGDSEQNIEFAVPVPNSPNTGFISAPRDPAYGKLVGWVRSVLELLGGEAARAADGGDCGLPAPREARPAQGVSGSR